MENPARPGTPDVNYVYGWIELKWARAWPKKSDTSFLIPHYTNQQRNFIRQRSFLGGDVWVLLKVSDEWLLFDWFAATEYLGQVSEQDLKHQAAKYWKKRLDDKELQSFLVKSFYDRRREPGVQLVSRSLVKMA